MDFKAGQRRDAAKRSHRITRHKKCLGAHAPLTRQVMHPVVAQLARHYGVGFCAHLFFTGQAYCGKTRTIALRYSKRGKLRYQTDHDLLHDIAHFVIASERQRNLPEFGFGFGTFIGERQHGAHIGSIKDDDVQEAMAQFLCIKWGQTYGISPQLSGEKPETFPNWQVYLASKTDPLAEGFSEYAEQYYRNKWEALICLKTAGLLDELPIPIESRGRNEG